jgi:hypothetical protein
MKRIKHNKLSFQRETLRSLSHRDLGDVHGAGSSSACTFNGCKPSGNCQNGEGQSIGCPPPPSGKLVTCPCPQLDTLAGMGLASGDGNC